MVYSCEIYYSQAFWFFLSKAELTPVSMKIDIKRLKWVEPKMQMNCKVVFTNMVQLTEEESIEEPIVQF